MARKLQTHGALAGESACLLREFAIRGYCPGKFGGSL
jgi:hypothetical protein